MARQEIHAWWWMRGVDIAWAILIPLASAVLLWYGGTRILHARRSSKRASSPRGALTVGDLVMFMSYLVVLLSPIETLANSAATTFQNNLAGLDRVLDLLGEPARRRQAPTR